MLGYDPEDILGKHIDIYYKSTSDYRYIYNILREQETLENFETELLRKDGSTIWGSTNAKILKDSEGLVLGIEGTTRDISNFKSSQEEKQKAP